jgi:hypothetical protein
MHVLADVAPRIAAHVSVVARVGLPIRAEVVRVCILAGIIPVEVLRVAPGERDEKQPRPEASRDHPARLAREKSHRT